MTSTKPSGNFVHESPEKGSGEVAEDRVLADRQNRRKQFARGGQVGPADRVHALELAVQPSGLDSAVDGAI